VTTITNCNITGGTITGTNLNSVNLAALGAVTPAAGHVLYYSAANPTANSFAVPSVARSWLGTLTSSTKTDNLTAFAGITGATASRIPYFSTSGNVMGLLTLGATGLSLISAADTAAARVSVGVPSTGPVTFGTLVANSVGTSSGETGFGFNDNGGVTCSVQNTVNDFFVINTGVTERFRVTGSTGVVLMPKVEINGGAIDGTTIGASTPSTGAFTNLTVSGQINSNIPGTTTGHILRTSISSGAGDFSLTLKNDNPVRPGLLHLNMEDTSVSVIDSSEFLKCSQGTDTKVLITRNGSIFYTGSLTPSDERLKTDFQICESQWDAIANVPFIRFRWRKDAPDLPLRIGVRAQELQKTNPDLVSYLEEQDVYAIKLDDFHTKAVVALQEAMRRIEVLEAKVAELQKEVA
jgi:hypothetical protein